MLFSEYNRFVYGIGLCKSTGFFLSVSIKSRTLFLENGTTDQTITKVDNGEIKKEKSKDKSKKVEKAKKEEITSPNQMYIGKKGKPLSESQMNQITQFQRKQNKGFIDVWWLYDDGGMLHIFY